MKNIKIILLIIVILLLAGLGYFVLIKNKTSQEEVQPSKTLSLLLPEMNEGGGLSITVTPIDFSFEKPVQFKIAFETHQGDLNFDLTKISYLLDDKNNKYIPVSWEGGTGGHHLSGTLVFPEIPNNTKQIKLFIKNVYDIESRQFLWNLK